MRPATSTILIVDDDLGTRMFLEELLQQAGCRVIQAANGQEALARLHEASCDLVLMDIHMPVMDGYLATQRIKAREQEGWFIPVIFLTSAQTDLELAKCLACGGDDFLSKPPNPILLRARLQAWLQRAELANQLAQDRLDVENVHLKMRQDDQFDPKGVRVSMTSMERTNGDQVLSARRQDGVQHIMVGDFAGHGLRAAIGSPMVADIFYRLTGQNLPLREIIGQINEAIYRKLPVNMFLAAAFLELDRADGIVQIWNAALPTVTLFRAGQVVASFSSRLLPLGIVGHVSSEAHETHPLLTGDRIYLCSDGVVETRSPTGELFGEERLVDHLTAMAAGELALESLLPVLAAFRAGEELSDDITLVEVR